MAANVTVTFSGASGFSPGIPGDAKPDVTDPILLSRTIDSDYEGDTISVNISYTAEVDDGTGMGIMIPAVVSNNSTSYNFSEIGLTYTKLTASTARISGKVSNVFPGTYYRFRMADGTFKILPPDTTEDWFVLVEYKMPSVTSVFKSYPVTITVEAAGIEPKQNVTINLTQNHYWNYRPAVATVKDLVSRGKQ
jgi:hypothetical protein